MARYLGLDWAGKGWFGVAFEDGGWSCDLYPTILSAWRAHGDANRILIDIPIGLPDRNERRRECDERAKALLGDQHSSVFYTPVRPAVYEQHLPDAKAINEEAGYSIQNQAWSIVPRIREVDEFLDVHPGARDRLRETHPEVCYQAFNDGPLSHPPNAAAGLAERRQIITEVAPEVESTLDAAIARFTTPRYAPMVTDASHIQDAFVAVLTARRDEDGIDTIPLAPPRDGRNLAMEIVYPTDSRQLTLEDAER